MDASDLVRGKVVEHHDVTGLERRRQELRHVGAKRRTGDRASSTGGATIPLARNPATKVVVR